MYKDLFSGFENVKAPESVVDKTVKAALLDNEKSKEVISVSFKRRGFATGVLAACLVLTFVCTLILGISSNNISTVSDTLTQGKKYSFTIRAGAKLPVESDTESETVIGAYAGTLTGGWAMYPNIERYEEESPNFFQSYTLDDFTLVGEGIESVTIKSNLKGTYFAISPAGYFTSADDELAQQQVQKSLEKFSDLSLENSQYTADELKEYSDGLSFGKIYCDTFTYTNSQKNAVIDLSGKLEFVLESDRSKDNMNLMLGDIWQCEQDLLAIRADHTFEEGEISKDEEELYEKLDDISKDILKEILKDSTVELIVRFEDGTVETKTLVMGLAETENGLWLTISSDEE